MHGHTYIKLYSNIQMNLVIAVMLLNNVRKKTRSNLSGTSATHFQVSSCFPSPSSTIPISNHLYIHKLSYHSTYYSLKLLTATLNSPYK